MHFIKNPNLISIKCYTNAIRITIPINTINKMDTITFILNKKKPSTNTVEG